MSWQTCKKEIQQNQCSEDSSSDQINNEPSDKVSKKESSNEASSDKYEKGKARCSPDPAA